MMENIKDTRIPDDVKYYLAENQNQDYDEGALEWLSEHIADSSYDNEFNDILESITPDTDHDSLSRSKKCLDAFIAIDEARRKKERRNRLSYFCCGFCSVAALLVAAVLIFKPREPLQWHEIYAARGETEKVTLSDGTSLWINSDTKVIYPSRFDSDTRTIFIDGEIYADVTHDENKPFVVSATGLNIKVHGTQFSVKAFAETDNVEVVLISGSVTMEDTNSDSGFSRTLIPGELIRYNKSFGTMEQYAIDPDTYGAWQNNHNIRFINQSLKEIAEDLERRFDVNILIEDETLSETQYYASFIHNEGLDKILHALNSNGSMTITKKHDTIVISPNK